MLRSCRQRCGSPGRGALDIARGGRRHHHRGGRTLRHRRHALGRKRRGHEARRGSEEHEREHRNNCRSGQRSQEPRDTIGLKLATWSGIANLSLIRSKYEISDVRFQRLSSSGHGREKEAATRMPPPPSAPGGGDFDHSGLHLPLPTGAARISAGSRGHEAPLFGLPLNFHSWLLRCWIRPGCLAGWPGRLAVWMPGLASLVAACLVLVIGARARESSYHIKTYLIRFLWLFCSVYSLLGQSGNFRGHA